MTTDVKSINPNEFSPQRLYRQLPNICLKQLANNRPLSVFID